MLFSEERPLREKREALKGVSSHHPGRAGRDTMQRSGIVSPDPRRPSRYHRRVDTVLFVKGCPGC